MVISSSVKIIAQDKVVIIDGEVYQFDFSIAPDVWAVTWDAVNGIGEVEYTDKPNAVLTDFTPYQDVIDQLDAHLATVAPSGLHVSDGQGGWVIDLDRYKQSRRLDIITALKTAVQGSVVCTVDGVDYTMDTNWDDPIQLQGAIDLAIKNGESTVSLIDFFGLPHPPISLESAEEVARQMGNNYQSLLQQYAIKNAQIDGVEIPEGGTVDDAIAILDGIVWA